jgi:signal-transduction protein with cAMP-binding, CBS, and nucleotidyltransferase domain
MDIRTFGHQPAVSCRKDAPIRKVAELMRDHNVGCVLVTDEHERLTGIVTDRDLAVRGYYEGRDPDDAVDTVATHDVMYVYENDDLFNTTSRMAMTGYRRLPVLDAGGRIKGLVSLDDLLMLFGAQIEMLGRTVRRELEYAVR